MNQNHSLPLGDLEQSDFGIILGKCRQNATEARCRKLIFKMLKIPEILVVANALGLKCLMQYIFKKVFWK